MQIRISYFLIASSIFFISACGDLIPGDLTPYDDPSVVDFSVSLINSSTQTVQMATKVEETSNGNSLSPGESRTLQISDASEGQSVGFDVVKDSETIASTRCSITYIYPPSPQPAATTTPTVVYDGQSLSCSGFLFYRE